MWIGVLFSMICLSTQLQQSLSSTIDAWSTSAAGTPAPQSSQSKMAVNTYREKVIQCLNLGQYTSGGPHVLETLILYFMIEVFPIREVEIGVWVLVGNIVQIATHMGYHRDPTHFSNISPFAGEMRRRVWAMIIQLDFSISTQMGMPRLIKESQTNTALPRNLNDSDFDQNSAELPASRPENEVTPTLYTLAKLRIVSVGSRIADLATGLHPYSYDMVLELDKQINEAQDTLPPNMKWEGLASCLTIPSLEIVQRIWLEMFVQRLKIVLHKKFIVSSQEQQYDYSKTACLSASMKILEFQHLVDEETQPDGRLYQIRWRVSTAFTHEFLLATSILCFYLKSFAAGNEVSGGQHDPPMDADTIHVEKIRQLLRASQTIWVRLSADSTEAQKAAAALQYVLGDSSNGLGSFGWVNMIPNSNAASNVPYFPSQLALQSYISSIIELTP